MRHRASCSVAIAAGLLCSGCGGGMFTSDLPAPTTYILAPAPAPASATVSAASETDLTVGLPEVAPGLDTQRIAVLRGRQLDYFRDARWGGSTREVIQSLVVATLQDQGLFRSVTAEQARIAAHYMLDIEVRRFHAEYRGGGAPQVHVGLVGRIIRIDDRRMIATVRAATEHAAAGNRMTSVAAAFEAAAQEVALKLARDTAQVIAQDARRTAPPPTSADSSVPF